MAKNGTEVAESLIVRLNVVRVLSQGTNIAAGKCRGICIGTGLNTEIGE